MNKSVNGKTASAGLQAIGGAFFFAALGGLLVIAIGSATSSQIPNSNPAGDFGYGVALLFMILIAAGVGGILGFVVVARLAKNNKVPRLTLTLATLGYVAAGFALFKFSQILDDGRAGANQAITQQAVHQAQINVEDQKLQDKASRELPDLMGRLIYPGAKSVHVDNPEYTRVSMSVTADLDKIDAYYKDLIFDRQREPLSLKGKATRPGDGTALLMATEHYGRTSYNITFILASNAGGPNKWPADWRASMPPPNATSYSDPSVIRNSPPDAAPIATQWQPTDQSPEIAATYGSLAYPGSNTNYGAIHLPPGKAPLSLVALSTTDSIEKVIAYYRPLVQVSVDNPDQFTGITTRLDGVRAFASIRRDGDYTIITLSAG